MEGLKENKIFKNSKKEVTDMRKFMHKISIELPIVSVLIVASMVTGMYFICIASKTDIYLKTEGVVNCENDSYEVIVDVDPSYYDGICEQNKVIWYTSLDSAVYDAHVKSVELLDNACKVIVSMDKDYYNKEMKSPDTLVNLKISYGTETVLKHLLND